MQSVKKMGEGTRSTCRISKTIRTKVPWGMGLFLLPRSRTSGSLLVVPGELEDDECRLSDEEDGSA